MRHIFLRFFIFVLLICLASLVPRVVFSEDLCIQLKWLHQSQFAGFYVAKEEGLYKAEGLDVEFVEGGPLIDWQERMKDVRCPIGITNPYEIAIARARGVPVKAVAAVDQVSPIVWFALKESGIREPRQF